MVKFVQEEFVVMEKKCSYTTKRKCRKATKQFCSVGFIRKGKCSKVYCCKNNKKGVLKCKYLTKLICKKSMKHVSKKVQKITIIKKKLQILKRATISYNRKYFFAKRKCMKNLKSFSKKHKKEIKKKFIKLNKSIKNIKKRINKRITKNLKKINKKKTNKKN